MSSNEHLNHRENGVRKLGDPAGAGKAERETPVTAPDSDADQTRNPQIDAARHDAVREASRLGASDTHLVDQDMEDMAEREGKDGPDGRPSPLANADNPER